MSKGSTLQSFRRHAHFVERILSEAGVDIDYSNLAALLRLRDIKERSPEKRDWYMLSEFAGMDMDRAVNENWVERKYEAFDWHPQKIGTFYYRLTEKGQHVINQSLAVLQRKGVKVIY
jgi:hypothetical protein